MKLANQEVVGHDYIRPELLTPIANAHFETLAFIEEHPEYLPCKQNVNAMTAELKKTVNGYPTYADMNNAYTKLQASGKLLTREKAREILSSAGDEAQKLYEREGIERFHPTRTDAYGNPLSIGYDLPEAFNPPPAEKLAKWAWRAGRQGKEVMPLTDGSLKGYKPTKREFLSWDGHKCKAWMEENGYVNGDLPDYLL